MRRILVVNSWLQLLLILLIAVFVNSWAANNFLRFDATQKGIYSLDLSTRSLVWRLDKPLYIKVYFSQGLQAPFNNHEAILMDKLAELQAYSQGWIQIEAIDPENKKELIAEASRFGIQAIQYQFRNQNRAELKKVYMGLALVYGEKQEVLPAITRVETLEYDLARAIRKLLDTEPRKSFIGLSTGHGEPNILTGGGPLQALRAGLEENHTLQAVTLGGGDEIPEDLDILWVVGPQKALSSRALYQIDQFVMRGGSLAVFPTNTKPDMRSLQALSVYHGLEGLLGHYGVRLNRDILVDRTANGKMSFPVRQGKIVRQVQINYPLIPKATILNRKVPVLRGLDSMLAPFVSSVELVEPLPPDINAEVWAQTTKAAGKIKGIRSIAPKAFQVLSMGEETGSWPILVGMTGTWQSYFADKDVPKNPAGQMSEPPKLRDGAPARIVVGGSADFVANNITFMLNLADWMVQDEQLINIRSKSVQLARFEPLQSTTSQRLKWLNMLSGIVFICLFGGVRYLWRRRSISLEES